jgi:hypothetical protein
MKKILLSIIALTITHSTFAQWTSSGTDIYNSNTGNVGIGTTTPSSKLEITSGASDPFYFNGTYNKIKAALGYTYIESFHGTSFVIDATASYSDRFFNVSKGASYIDGGSPVELFRIQENGNVGIGTTSPTNKLEVQGGANATTGVIDGIAVSTVNTSYTTKGRMGSNFDSNYITQNAYFNGSNWLSDNSSHATSGIIFTANNQDGSINFYTSATNNAGIGTQQMIIDKSGNVGIGTVNPGAKLQVQGGILSTNNGLNNIALNSAGANYGFISNNAANKWSLGYGTTVSTLGTPVLTWNSSGSVGIGTTNPDQLLTVNGTIHSTEVKVDLNMPAPDYVFDTNYRLTDLGTLKAYLDQNHHLPEIPSAAQMAKDGLNLGDMNTKLLKKVEELTLYLIEKEQQVKEIKEAQQSQSEKLQMQKLQDQKLQDQLKVMQEQLNNLMSQKNKS